MDLDALVAPLRADVTSGAARVARAAADVARQAAVRLPAADAAELRHGLGQVAVRVLDAQPAMAPLVALLRDVLTAVEGVADLGEARRRAAHAAERFHVRLDEGSRRVARWAARILARDATVVTVSSSSTVRGALLEAAPRGVAVVCLEGRPGLEGRALAGALAEAGVPVTLAVDAAASSLLAGADHVLLGADSVGDRGVVNKIGSAALAREARARGIPVHVVADATKLLPTGFPQPLDDDRPAHEVWEAPAGVRVWNRYFEALPLEAVDGLVTEEGVLAGADVEALRGAMDVPPELRHWAASRGSAGAAGGNGEPPRG